MGKERRSDLARHIDKGAYMLTSATDEGFETRSVRMSESGGAGMNQLISVR